jgi:PII-like signaling protein
MAEQPLIVERLDRLVLQGCSIHRGHNVKNCIGCVDSSLQRLVQAVQVVIDVMEERHEATLERQDATIESFKAIKAALDMLHPEVTE